MKHIFKSPLLYLNALLFAFLALLILNANADRLHLSQIVKSALAAVVRITGTGTQGKLAVFAQTVNQIGDSIMYDDGTRVGIGTTNPTQKLDVAGQIHAAGDICTDTGGGGCLSTATRKSYDVRNYGAIPNDGIDDTVAFQQAMDACLAAALAGPSESLTVYVPVGIFNINSTVRGACSIQGENRAISLLQYEGTAPITMLRYDSKAHFSIKSLGFKTTQDGHQTTDVHIKNSVYFVIDDVASWVGTSIGGNNKVTGIYVEGTASGPSIPPRGTGEIRNYLYTARPQSGKPGSYGIHIHANGQPVEGVVIDGTYNIEEADVGIFFDGAARSNVVGSGTIGGHTTANLKFTNADGNVIIGARLTASPKQIIADADSENNTFIGIICFNPVFCGSDISTYGSKATVLNDGDFNNVSALNAPLGIGTTDPDSKLHVKGGLGAIFENSDSAACTTANSGAIIANGHGTASAKLYFCNGAAWVLVAQ